MKLNDPISVARNIAAALHRDVGQRYDNGEYLVHLESVAGVLLRYGETSKVMLTGAYLHDVVEDCGISIESIKDIFGDKVSVLVGALTDEPGETRKERKAKTYPKIKATPGATKVKLADRIANIEQNIVSKNERQFRMYSKEAADFEAALRDLTDAELRPMWEHLNHLYNLGESKFAPKQLIFASEPVKT